jgi:hypothetical protein
MKYSLGLLTLLCLVVAGCADPVNVDNFNRIQPGMTIPEVEEIMGGRRPESYQTLKTWRGPNSRTITIETDDRGLVVNKTRDGF